MRAFRFLLVFYVLFAASLPADEKEWRALDEAALAAANEGRLDDARRIAGQALTMAQKELGKDDLRTAGSLALLAEVLMALENWTEAEARLREAGEIRERKLKPGHPDLEQTQNLMGRLLTARGRFDEAEPLHLKALAAAERAANAGEAGPAAPRWTDVIANLDLLATFYHARGNDAKASEMRRRAVEALARYASSDKEDHLQRLGDLAQSATNQSAYDDAERVAAEQVHLAEVYFGTKGLATTLPKLATMFEEHAEYARAEPLYRRLLPLQEKALGATHLDVASTLHELAVLSNLAWLYAAEEQYQKAEPLYLRALAILEKTYGPDDSTVTRTARRIGELYRKMGRNAEAERFEQKAGTPQQE